jgi:hypothetical protein
MRGYTRVASVGLLMMGLLAVPNLSLATDRDGNGRHHLLNGELRAKIEHLRDKMAKHHEHGGSASSLPALEAEVTGLKTDLAGMASNEALLLSQLNNANAQISALTNRLIALEGKATGGSTDPVLAQLAKYVKVVETGDLDGVKGPHVIFDKVNLHLRSGSNATNDNGTLTGLGNFIVGYNERQITPIVYDGLGCTLPPGSHNIVTGTGNIFTSYAGHVVGSNNCITSPNTSILAGDTNEAHSPNSAILGGTRRGTSETVLNQTVPVIR